jgi:hypothetical protein
MNMQRRAVVAPPPQRRYTPRGANVRPNQVSLQGSPNWQEIAISLIFGAAFALPLRRDSPIYLGELIGLALCIGTLFVGRLWDTIRQLRLEPLVAVMPIMFVGYIVSDLAAATDSGQMVKASARLIFQFTNLLAVAYFLAGKPRRFDWLILGYAVSTSAFGLLDPMAAIWKFSGAIQLDLVAAFIAKRVSRPVGVGLLFAVGVLNLLLDCRSAAAVAILTGAIFFVALSSRHVKSLGILQIIAIVAVGAVGLDLAWKFVSPADLQRQRSSSNGRSSEIAVVLRACLRSPIIGHGSDYVSSELMDELTQTDVDKAGSRKEGVANFAFKGHSEILQTWFEGGALGTALFVIMLLWSGGAIRRLMAEQSIRFSDPVILSAITVCCWDLLMSPFGGGHRCSNAILFGGVMIVRVYHRSPKYRPAFLIKKAVLLSSN